jgi:hypothetical protein
MKKMKDYRYLTKKCAGSRIRIQIADPRGKKHQIRIPNTATMNESINQKY